MLGNKIKELRKEKGLTLKRLGELLNLGESTMSMYESGKRNPDYETLRKIAEIFECSTDYLLGLSGSKGLDNFIKSVPSVDLNDLVKIPILGIIKAGEPMYAIENIEGYEYVDGSEAKNGEFFYLRVNGDSMMNARIYDGDLVYVRQQPDVESGEIAVVLVNGYEATLKRVLKTDDSIILQPENPKYKPMVFDSKKVESGYIEIVGKVLHVKFKV